MRAAVTFLAALLVILSTTSEVALKIRTDGRQSASAEVRVNGKYNQTVLFHPGMEETEVLLGRLPAGEHAVVVDGPGKFEAETRVLQGDLVAEYAPFLYARAGTVEASTDVPLLLYCERRLLDSGSTELTYTIVFSNEDGGTATEGLLARWGRTTDIEWMYRVVVNAKGKVEEETYQGRDHKTRKFHGRHEGNHPLLYASTLNNNFSDRGQAGHRFALRPVEISMQGHSREQIMDLHPWSYRVMAEELSREGKPFDPLRWLILEAEIENRGTAVSFVAELKDGSRVASDLGDPRLRIERSGWVRSVILLPSGATLNDLRTLDVVAHAFTPKGKKPEKNPVAQIKSVSKGFMLDNQFRPAKPLTDFKPGGILEPGQSLRVWQEKGE